MIEGTVEQACQYLDTLASVQAIEAAVADETRKGVLAHAQARIEHLLEGGAGQQQQQPPPPQQQQPNPTPNPTDDNPAACRFVVRTGAPSMMTLRPTRSYYDNLAQQRKDVPGVVYKATILPDGSGARVIDCTTAPETRRPVDPITPAEMAALIRATRYYQQGLILDWDTWEIMRERETAAKAAADAVRAEYDARIAAKIGKRGAA